jgi:Cys-rich protein (TIGR01571 family)
MIRSPEDAEVFENISSATGVRISASRNSKRRNHQPQQHRLRNFTSPPVTNSRNLGSASFAGSELETYSSMSMDVNDYNDAPKNDFFYSEHSGAHGEQKDFFRKDPVPLEPSTSLDFIHNDNSFQVLANVLVDFFDARVRRGQLTLEANDADIIERLLPASARRHFIEAVQYRLERTPASPQSQLDFLTIQCQELGLDRDGPENPIVATAMLDENETYVTLPVLCSRSKEEIIPSDSDETDNSEQDWVDLTKKELEKPSPVVVDQSSHPVKAETTAYETNRVRAANEKNFTRTATTLKATQQAPATVIEEPTPKRETSFDFPDPDSTDNIVQRTLLMELHEAHQMMQASTSLETVEFWESHMEDLKAKYRALLGKPKLSSAPILPPSPTTTIDTHEYHFTQPSMSLESGQQQYHLSQSQASQDQVPESRQGTAAQQPMQPKKSIFFPQPTPPSQTYLEKRTSASMDAPQIIEQTMQEAYEPPTFQASNYPAPTANRVLTPVSVLPGTPNPPATPVRMDNVVIIEEDAESIASQTPNPPATPYKVSTPFPPKIANTQLDCKDPAMIAPPAAAPVVPQMACSGLPEPDYNVPMVDVVAPADLPGGYNFEAEVEGQRFLATVPAGGVKEGETFTCYMRQLDSMASETPIGYWRDGICGLCSFGCCHPVVWNSILCPLVALAQVQYRANLDFLGRPNLFYGAAPNRAMMVTIILFWIVINAMLLLGYNIKWSQNMDLTIADWTSLAVINGAYLCFIVFVTQSTRSSLRDKYLIREQACNDLEDLCCATCCLPCSISQMSRHTGNYDEYEAVCCSRTGLPDGIGEHERASLRRSHGPSSYVV